MKENLVYRLHRVYTAARQSMVSPVSNQIHSNRKSALRQKRPLQIPSNHDWVSHRHTPRISIPTEYYWYTARIFCDDEIKYLAFSAYNTFHFICTQRVDFVLLLFLLTEPNMNHRHVWMLEMPPNRILASIWQMWPQTHWVYCLHHRWNNRRHHTKIILNDETNRISPGNGI